MGISERMKLIEPSGTIKMLEKAKKMAREGRKILHLEVGEPDFDTPEHIKKAAYKAIEEGFTHYTSSKGILELREAISDDLRKNGIVTCPETEILVTPGAKHALYCASLATLNPKDEVLIISPSWPTHFACVQAAEAIPIQIPSSYNTGLDEDALKEKITRNTKMILVSSPNNPTGNVLTQKESKIVADLAKDHELLVISDEIYNKIVYDESVPVSVASLDGMKEKTVVLNGFSKTYAMTGWRLGYAAASGEIIGAMQKIQQNTTTCPASFVQMAGLEALKGSQSCVREMVHEYDKRRKLIVKKMKEIPGVKCCMPKGAFYVFPDFSVLKMASSDIVEQLLEKEGVCSTAGSVFGSFGEGRIRFSYSTNRTTILEAMDRLKKFVEKN